MPEEVKNTKKDHPFPLIVKEITFVQPWNCCTKVSEREDEELNIKFDTGGGGFFSIISTKNFAIENDSDTFSKINELCNLICKNNDVIEEQNIKDYGKIVDSEEERARIDIEAYPPRTAAPRTSAPRTDDRDIPF